MPRPDAFTAADVTRANLFGYFKGLLDMAVIAAALAVIALAVAPLFRG